MTDLKIFVGSIIAIKTNQKLSVDILKTFGLTMQSFFNSK